MKREIRAFKITLTLYTVGLECIFYPVKWTSLFSRVLFVLGAINNESLQAALDNETAHYNDIIQNNFYDSYR